MQRELTPRYLYFAQFVSREAAAELHFASRLYTLQRQYALQPGLQSMQRPWLPLYVGLVNLALNALLDWLLLGPLGSSTHHVHGRQGGDVHASANPRSSYRTKAATNASASRRVRRST